MSPRETVPTNLKADTVLVAMAGRFSVRRFAMMETRSRLDGVEGLERERYCEQAGAGRRSFDGRSYWSYWNSKDWRLDAAGRLGRINGRALRQRGTTKDLPHASIRIPCSFLSAPSTVGTLIPFLEADSKCKYTQVSIQYGSHPSQQGYLGTYGHHGLRLVSVLSPHLSRP